MRSLQQLGQDILDGGKVDTAVLDELRSALYADGKISRPEALFMVELHKRVRTHTPAFENFVYKVLKDHVLADGRIDAAEAGWLRGVIFHDGVVSDRERKFLNELKGEATHASAEFEALFAEAMKTPTNPHTSGSGR